MREHMGLHRGKEINTGLWMRGYYVCLHDSKGNVSHRIYNAYAETDCGDFYPDWFEVDPDTVGECTGLRDKNGKLIFEGDIVLFKWDKEYDYCHFIEFVDGEFLATPALSLENLWSIRICGENEKFTVIGNIHDNPELLKGGEDE